VPKTRFRNPSREQFWRDTTGALKASGQSVRAFCAARGLNEATFYARRRELGTGRHPLHPARLRPLANVCRGSRRP
jgi:hypothetical protein